MKAYYVTLIRDDKRVAWLAGPYATHEQALALVDRAWLKACDVDPWCHFYARGTASITRPTDKLSDFPRGRITHLLEEVEA